MGESAAETIIHEDLEPGVIDTDMIVKSVLEHSPKGELGRLIAEEGVTLEEVKELRLEFLNILRIDHLWMMDSLEVLHVSNNLIEKIENLEKLVNLKELDLSFNNIEEMENLGTLVNLEVLSLFENKISKIQNIENLRALQIFSIGNNNLEDLDNVVYLRIFQNLKALNMAGNPVAKSEDFKEYVYAFLPQLVYYEYRMIAQTEREIANVKFREERKRVLGDEAEVKEEIPEELKDIDRIELLQKAFVDNIDEHLFNNLFKFDPEGVAFLKMNEDSEEQFIDFKDRFLCVCQELVNFGVAEYLKRRQEMDEYETSVKDAKETVTSKSRDMLNDFIERKSEIFYEMRVCISYLQADIEGNAEDEETSEEQEVTLRRLAAEFLQLSHYVWQELMRMEMNLYEQIDEVTSNFEVNLRELLSQFSEGCTQFFVRLRDEQTNYFEQMSDIALRYLTNLNIRMGDITFKLDEDLKEIMMDRESMTAALAGSHEIHVQLIDDRQDTLTRQVEKWTDEFFEKLKTDEVKRNRAKIVETSHFMDLQQDEYDEIIAATDLHFDEPFLGESDGFEMDLGRSVDLDEIGKDETRKSKTKAKIPSEEEGEGKPEKPSGAPSSMISFSDDAEEEEDEEGDEDEEEEEEEEEGEDEEEDEDLDEIEEKKSKGTEDGDDELMKIDDDEEGKKSSVAEETDDID